MKKISLLLCLLFIMYSLCGCSTANEDVSSVADNKRGTVVEEWQDEYIKKAIESLKTHQKKLLTSDDDQYLEIKNTRLITIKDDANDPYGIFDDVECVVEFMLLTNYYGVSPYYFYTTDSYAVYKNGTVKAHDAFSWYRQTNDSTDFSKFIGEIYDLDDYYNEVYDLADHIPQAPEIAKLPDPKPIAEGTSLEIRDDDQNVLLTESDIKLVSANYLDEKYFLKLEFTSDGAIRLKEATEQNVSKKLSIYVNNALLSMPTVASVITDGVVRIDCIDSFTLEDAFEKLTEK